MKGNPMFVGIIRAWKDPKHGRSLSVAEQAILPLHPAGLTDLTAEEIRAVSGGEDKAEVYGEAQREDFI